MLLRRRDKFPGPTHQLPCHEAQVLVRHLHVVCWITVVPCVGGAADVPAPVGAAGVDAYYRQAMQVAGATHGEACTCGGLGLQQVAEHAITIRAGRMSMRVLPLVSLVVLLHCQVVTGPTAQYWAWGLVCGRCCCSAVGVAGTLQQPQAGLGVRTACMQVVLLCA